MAKSKCTKENMEIAEQYLLYYNKEPYNEEIPSVVGLACALNVSKSTVYLWQENASKEMRPVISDIIKRIGTSQERILKNSGLNKTFSSKITTLLLSKHGVIEKTESEVDQNINIKIIDKF